MRPRHDTRPADLRQPAWCQWIADTCGLTDDSAAVPHTTLAHALLLAATLGLAVSAVARRAVGRGRESIRKGIAASLPADPRERRLAAGFRPRLRRTRRRRPVPIALDRHRRPYYGDRTRTPGVTGAQAERGTRWCWSYATAVALRPGHRHTLGRTTVARAETAGAVVERRLAPVAARGVRVRYVLLDRGFFAVGVIHALPRRGRRFVLPMLRRGPATKFFCRSCRGWFAHTIRCRRAAEGAGTVRVAVVAGADADRPWVFACSAGFGRLPAVVLRYRRRFGIESSYRPLGQCRAGTTSRDAVYRLLRVGISLLIRSWWVASRGWTVGAVRWQLILALTPPAGPPTQTPNPKRHPT